MNTASAPISAIGHYQLDKSHAPAAAASFEAALKNTLHILTEYAALLARASASAERRNDAAIGELDTFRHKYPTA